MPVYLIDPQTPILISGLVRGCISAQLLSLFAVAFCSTSLCFGWLMNPWIYLKKSNSDCSTLFLGCFSSLRNFDPSSPSYLNISELHFLSSLPCQAPLPSNSCLLTFSTSPSLLLRIGKCLGGSRQLGESQSVSLFLQDLGHSNPTTVFFFFLSNIFLKRVYSAFLVLFLILQYHHLHCLVGVK